MSALTITLLPLLIANGVLAQFPSYGFSPPCAKTANCTNASFDKGRCARGNVEFPGLDVPSLKANSAPSSSVFDIINCGQNATEVQQYLADIQNMASAATNDSELVFDGQADQHGYNLFFGNPSSVSTVQSIYNDISNGTIPYFEGCFAGQKPAVICIDESMSIPPALQRACTIGSPAFTSTDWTSGVFVCPSFFSLTNVSAESLPCPQVSGNKVTPDDASLLVTPQGSLLQLFAKLYLGPNVNIANTKNIQASVDLDESKQLVNPYNYAYYASTVRKNCPL